MWYVKVGGSISEECSAEKRRNGKEEVVVRQTLFFPRLLRLCDFPFPFYYVFY